MPATGKVDGMDAVKVRSAGPSDVAALSDLAKRTWSDAFGVGVGRDDEAAELEEAAPRPTSPPLSGTTRSW
jgi:hypothetical protein